MKRSRLRTRTPLKAKLNAAGKPRERFEGLRLEDYRAWIREQPCILTGEDGHHCWHPQKCSDACHVESKARGAGDAGNLVPMCRRAHQEQHDYGLKSFEREHAGHLQGQTLRVIAGGFWLRYEDEKGAPRL